CRRSVDHCVLDNLSITNVNTSDQTSTTSPHARLAHRRPAHTLINAAFCEQTNQPHHQRQRRRRKKLIPHDIRPRIQRSSQPSFAPSIATAEKKSTIERFNAAASPNRKDIELLRSVFRAARLLSAKSSKPLLPLFPEMQSSRVVFPSPQLRRLRCAFIPTSA